MQPITELIPASAGIGTETHPRRAQMKSRDFYWCSPVKMTGIGRAPVHIGSE